MRYVQTSAPQHQHQHQPQTMAMTAVRTPDGGMGWIPAHMLGQPSPQQQMAMAQMQAQYGQPSQAMTMMMPQQPAPTVVVQPPEQPRSTLKTLLVLGGVGLVGYWAYKKWGRSLLRQGKELFEDTLPEPAEDSEDLAAGERRHVRSRRRRRSRSRMLSEFKNFLDSGANEEAGECLGCMGDVDDYEQVEGGVNY